MSVEEQAIVPANPAQAAPDVPRVQDYTREKILAQEKGARLSKLGREINGHHEAAVALAQQAANTAYEAIKEALLCGGKLLEAKGELEHGAFINWRNAHCPSIGKYQAQQYMRLARFAKGCHGNRAALEGARGIRHAYQLAGIIPGPEKKTDSGPKEPIFPGARKMPDVAGYLKRLLPAGQWPPGARDAFKQWLEETKESLEAMQKALAE